MRSKDAIRPTPAGTKKSAIFCVNAFDTLLTSRGFTNFSKRDKNNRTIPQTLPGTIPLIKKLKNSPKK